MKELTSEWKDITSYSKGDTEHVPRTVELRNPPLCLIVTRRIHLEGWYIHCEPFYYYNQLDASELDAAKLEALDKVRKCIKDLAKTWGI